MRSSPAPGRRSASSRLGAADCRCRPVSWGDPLSAPTACRQGPAGKVRPIATLNDVITRFAALSDMQRADHVHVHGTALAVGMDWVVRLPAGKARDAALERLAEAAELACAALSTD